MKPPATHPSESAICRHCGREIAHVWCHVCVMPRWQHEDTFAVGCTPADRTVAEPELAP